MPKQFYCSTCGIELIHSRKAVPGKGTILDLITPHECEGYSIKSNEFEKPTVEDVIDSLKDVGKVIEAESQEIHTGFGEHFEEGDRRSDKDKITSIAPKNLLSGIKGFGNSEPEDDLE